MFFWGERTWRIEKWRSEKRGVGEQIAEIWKVERRTRWESGKEVERRKGVDAGGK